MIASAHLQAVPVGPRRHGPTTRIVFALDAPTAESVSVIGSFNHWNPRLAPMRPGADGHWHVQLHLPAGFHRYRFLINGRRWIVDPFAKLCASNVDGSPTSVLVIRGVESVSP